MVIKFIFVSMVQAAPSTNEKSPMQIPMQIPMPISYVNRLCPSPTPIAYANHSVMSLLDFGLAYAIRGVWFDLFAGGFYQAASSLPGC